MDTLLEAIREAVAADATDDVRATGASACRTILAALDAKAGEPLPMPQPTPLASLATAIGALRNFPPEQLLDLAIARLRAALPSDVPAPSVQPLKFQLITVPNVASRSQP